MIYGLLAPAPGGLIIGYARTSTKMVSQELSIKGQKEQLVAAGCHQVIVEHGRSAFKTSVRRPGWETLVEMIRTGKVTGVMLCNLSRASRRGEDIELLRLCQEMNVEVKFLDGTPGDISNPSARLTTGVLSVVNEVSSMYKQIAIKNGLRRSEEAGNYTKPKVPYGYTVADGWPAPHPEEFAKAREMWDLLAANEFNVYKVSRENKDLPRRANSLHSWMRRPMLRGIVNDEPGKVQALITAEEYARALQCQDNRRKFGARAPRRIRLFSNLVVCTGCNTTLNQTTKAGKVKLRCYTLDCDYYCRGLAEWKVKAQVIEALRDAVDQMEELANQRPPDRTPILSPEQEQIRKDLDQLLVMQATGVEGLGRPISNLRRRLEVAVPSPTANWTNWAHFIRQDGFLEGMTDMELRAVVTELVEEIAYIGNPDKVKITLRDPS